MRTGRCRVRWTAGHGAISGDGQRQLRRESGGFLLVLLRRGAGGQAGEPGSQKARSQRYRAHEHDARIAQGQQPPGGKGDTQHEEAGEDGDKQDEAARRHASSRGRKDADARAARAREGEPPGGTLQVAAASYEPWLPRRAQPG